jgi:hypothetical protein
MLSVRDSEHLYSLCPYVQVQLVIYSYRKSVGPNDLPVAIIMHVCLLRPRGLEAPPCVRYGATGGKFDLKNPDL